MTLHARGANGFRTVSGFVKGGSAEGWTETESKTTEGRGGRTREQEKPTDENDRILGVGPEERNEMGDISETTGRLTCEHDTGFLIGRESGTMDRGSMVQKLAHLEKYSERRTPRDISRGGGEELEAPRSDHGRVKKRVDEREHLFRPRRLKPFSTDRRVLEQVVRRLRDDEYRCPTATDGAERAQLRPELLDHVECDTARGARDEDAPSGRNCRDHGRSKFADSLVEWHTSGRCRIWHLVREDDGIGRCEVGVVEREGMPRSLERNVSDDDKFLCRAFDRPVRPPDFGSTAPCFDCDLSEYVDRFSEVNRAHRFDHLRDLFLFERTSE